jgi:amino acid transporter
LHLAGIEEPTSAAVTTVGVAWIILMTLVCYIGIELSANSQKVLLAAEIVILLIFAAVALTKVYSGAVPGTRIALSWFNPFTIDGGADFMQAMLIAIFIYWGWDTGAAVNEETKNPTGAPARAAVISTLLLVAIYAIVGCAAICFAEPELEKYTGDDFLAPLANHVLGPGMDKLLLIAVLTSAAACTQTTILPAVRTALSMARAGSLPKEFAEIHPRFLTPGFATLAMGAVSIVWYLALVIFSNNNVLTDSVTATAIGIAFYYGLTGFACVAYFRHEIFKSAKNFIFIGLIPGVGALSMLALFVGSCINFASPDQSKTSFAGVGTALIFGAGGMLIGVVLMLWMRLVLPAFFARRTEVADPTTIAQS